MSAKIKIVSVLYTCVYIMSFARMMTLQFHVIDFVIVLSGIYIVTMANSNLIVLI